jgi:Protein of unknown function (DUF3710)
VFGRRNRTQDPTPPPGGVEALERVPHDVAGGMVGAGLGCGPYDADEAPDDGWIRLDLGSLRLPMPDGAQLQVEVDRAGPVRAVHLVTGIGQFTITAFAAPRSGGLWREVAPELVARLRADGGRAGHRRVGRRD